MEGTPTQEPVKPLLSSILTENKDGVDQDALARVTNGKPTKFVVDKGLGRVLADNVTLLNAVLREHLVESIDI